MMEASELIERLEKATWPDRNLDAALHVALVKPEQRADDLRYFRVPSASMDHMEMCAPGTYWLKERSGASLQTAPAYTASLDAALSLVERVLPGWSWGVTSPDNPEDDPALQRQHFAARVRKSVQIVRGHAATPALALCLALLRASPTEEPALPPQAEAAQDSQPQE